MQKISKKLRTIWQDQRAGEVIEYALILGLIAVAAIVVIGSVGVKVLGRWNGVNDGL